MAIDIPALLVATAALVGAAISYMNSRTARREQGRLTEANSRKVELEAFDAARELWQAAVSSSAAEIAALRQELTEAKRVITEAKRGLIDTQGKLAKELVDRKFLEQQVNELRLSVGRLQHRLKEVGVHEFDDGE